MWLTDPITKRKSVSLTLMMLVFVLAMGANIAQMFGRIKEVGITTELLYTFVGLYFGRRFTYKGKSVELDGKTLDDKVN